MCPTIWSRKPSITCCRWSSSEARIHAAQRQGFADVCRRDARGVAEIGDGARHFQPPLTRAPRETEASHRVRKQPVAGLIRPTPVLHLGICKPCVTCPLARTLPAPRLRDPLRGRSRRFVGLACERREVAG